MYELITIEITSAKSIGMGRLLYKTHPTIGEWIEKDIDEVGTMFEVIMVAHSSEGVGSDIYVKRLAETSACVQQLSIKHFAK